MWDRRFTFDRRVDDRRRGLPPRRLSCGVLLAVVCCTTTPAWCQDTEATETPTERQLGVAGLSGDFWLPWTFTLDVGADWVSAAAQPQDFRGDRSANRVDDIRFRTSFEADYHRDSGPGDYHLAYSVSEMIYDNHNDDVQTHALNTRYTWNVHPRVRTTVKAGVTHYRLDDSGFLNRYTGGVSADVREQPGLFGRFSYDLGYADSQFNESEDAVSHRVSVAQVYRLPEYRASVSGGYAFTRENASANRWSYDGHQVFLGGKIAVLERGNLSGKLSYAWKTYDGRDPLEVTKHREDETFGSSLQYAHAVNRVLTPYVGYSYSKNTSNLSRQRYDSHTVSAGVTIRW